MPFDVDSRATIGLTVCISVHDSSPTPCPSACEPSAARLDIYRIFKHSNFNTIDIDKPLQLNLCYCQVSTNNENIVELEQVVQTDGAENDVEIYTPMTHLQVSLYRPI